MLAHRFLGSLAEREGERTLGEDVLEALCAYDWPGNVREVENLIERLVILSENGRIAADDLPAHIRSFISEKKLPHPNLTNGDVNLRQALEQFEDRMIDEALRWTNGNRTAAASLLGLKRTTLVAKLRRKKNQATSFVSAK